MKILQLVQKPQRRGAEVFACQLSQALRRQGHTACSVYLYPYSGQGSLALYPSDSLLGGQDGHPFEKLPGAHPALLRRLVDVVATFQPDIVQANGASTVKYGSFARRAWGGQPWALVYRNIGNPHDWVRGGLRRFFYRRLVMPQVDGVIGVSHRTLNTVRAFYNLSVPLCCIANGIELPTQVKLARQALRDRMQTPPGAPVLLFVGSLSSEKRVDRLLRVAQQVAQHVPHLRLWLVGDGPQRRQLEAQAQSSGLAASVHFFGVQEDVASYMAAADLFLLTSDTEGIPAVLLEAGAAGLPVVATRVGGISECVRDGETGLLVDPQDEIGLAAGVTMLLQDPVRRQHMGERARAWVTEHFAMDKIAGHYLAFYEEVLTGMRTS